MEYRFASCGDAQLLAKRRLHFLGVDASHPDYEALRENCLAYFEKALAEDTCDAILAWEQGEVIGTGLIFYYDAAPSVLNVTGKEAYITNIYVAPEHRGKGMARTIVTTLIDKAKVRGRTIVQLSATDMGRPVYKKIGFTELTSCMMFDNRPIQESDV